MPRGPSPVLLQLADVLAIDAHAAHVAAIAFMRSPSLTAAAARAVANPPLSAALSLSASCANTSAVAPMACCRRLCRARTRIREIVRGQGVARTQ
jgi:NhaP-type Na+/H+ or K+/H+ antiporter